MIPAHLEFAGIASVALDSADGELRLALSDGSVAAGWWPFASLREFMTIVTPPQHAPADAVLQ